MKVTEHYDKNLGKATVILTDKKSSFVGVARVHPDDISIASELTGLNIAYFKALIKRKKFKLSKIKEQIRYFKGMLKNWEDNYDIQLESLEETEYDLENYLDDKEKLGNIIKRILALTPSTDKVNENL